MIFYFNHFSLIIFYNSVWLGFELFGLRVLVCNQLVQFTLTRKGYDNHHCHNKPQRWAMGLECGWRHAWKRWAENLRMLKITSVEFQPWCWKVGLWHGVEKLESDHALEDSRLDHAGRQLSFCHWGRELFSAIELNFWPLRRVPTREDELRSKTPRDVPNVGGGVSIVWWWKTFKNCVSLLVSKNQSQKSINRSYLNNSVLLYLYYSYTTKLLLYCCWRFAKRFISTIFVYTLSRLRTSSGNSWSKRKTALH